MPGRQDVRVRADRCECEGLAGADVDLALRWLRRGAVVEVVVVELVALDATELRR